MSQNTSKVTGITTKEDTQNYHKYMDSLSRIVEEYKQKFPEKYKFAQQNGEVMMTSDYNPTSGLDKEGDDIRLNRLLDTIKNYDLQKEDLSEEEINFLTRMGHFRNA